MDSVINDDTVIFQWTDIAAAVEYGIQVDINPDFSSPIIDTTLTDIQYSVSSLYDGDYYWRVNAKDDVGNWCSWSSFNMFTVDAILSIYIDDDNIEVDWSWAVNQWWCSGSGIKTDPYVIKDITINAENSGSGIEIRNSDVCFVIENCDIHGSGSKDFDGGIYLYNTDNGMIINNNCSFNNNYGIYLFNSTDNTIKENIVSDNLNGIRLYMSSYNTILKNTIENNRFDTCFLDGGSNNIVSNNYAFDNTYGFGMHLSSYNSFTNNIAMEIEYNCYILSDSSYNTFINNTASGKDFLSDGFRIHMNSNNNNFTGNKALNNALRGFFLSDHAYDNTFSENIVIGDGITNTGFWLQNVDNNLIFRNEITGTSVGIKIWDYPNGGSFDNIIWGNNFTGNELHAQDDGINNQWDNGTLGNYWDDYSGIDYNDDGIGDSPCIISGSAGSLDNYPIWDDGENTPIGGDVELDDPISGVYIKFSNITEGGTTSVITSDIGNPPPSGFSVSGQYYDITTTASYSGVITIAIPYNVGNPRLMHWSTENGQWEDITTWVDTVNKIIYGEVESLSIFALIIDITHPSITVETPGMGQALQDGVVFTVKAEDVSGVILVNLTIREDNGANGIFIHDDYENMLAVYDELTNKWQLFFDTTELPDGYYILIVEAGDRFDNIGLNITSFSIRNWAILVLLPSTEQSNPGRTMPVKYSLRVAEAVDPNTPFVYNEELSIVIYAFNNPEVILQLATFGDGSLNYRIDSIGELYITNFKTLKTPEVYTVEIWRKGFLIGNFTFETVDKKADTSVDTNYDWIDGSTLVFSAGIAFVNIYIIWIPIVFLSSIILWRKRNKKYNN
jgi:parallel beta-helix repeat protein